MSGSNRAYVQALGSELLYTDMISSLEFELTNISEEIAWLSHLSSEEISQLTSEMENELQSYDIDFDGEIDVNEATKIMRKRQDIETKFQTMIDSVLAKANKSEKFLNQRKTLKETMLSNFRAWLDSLKEWLGKVDCSYMD